MARITKEALYKLAESAGDGALDDLIHDVHSRNASLVNNEGATSQVDCLLEMGWSPETIESEISDILSRPSGPQR